MKPSIRGETDLRCRRRSEDPMRAFDASPAPVRRWLSQATLPWSPVSCRKILRSATARGEDIDRVLARLDRAERQTLARGQGDRI